MGVLVSGDQRWWAVKISEVLPEFSLYHGTYHKMPIVGKHLITHWIWAYHGKPRAQPAKHVAVFIFERSQFAQERSVGLGSPSKYWCVLVSRWGLRARCLTCGLWLSVVGRGKLWQKTAAEQTFLMKPMGNCWSWVRVEPRDSHESVSWIWGWGGGRSEKQMRHSFRPKSYHDYALEDHAVKWYHWYHVKLTSWCLPRKSSWRIQQRTSQTGSMHRVWCLMNCVQLCSMMFNVCFGFTDSLKIYVANTCRKTDYCRCINLKIVWSCLKPCRGSIFVDLFWFSQGNWCIYAG